MNLRELDTDIAHSGRFLEIHFLKLLGESGIGILYGQTMSSMHKVTLSLLLLNWRILA